VLVPKGSFQVFIYQISHLKICHILLILLLTNLNVVTAQDLEEALEMGVDWSLREGNKNPICKCTFIHVLT